MASYGVELTAPQLQEEPNCPCCSGRFRDPRVLDCGHTLDYLCIPRQNRRFIIVYQCPICLVETKLPSGVDLKVDTVIYQTAKRWALSIGQAPSMTHPVVPPTPHLHDPPGLSLASNVLEPEAPVGNDLLQRGQPVGQSYIGAYSNTSGPLPLPDATTAVQLPEIFEGNDLAVPHTTTAVTAITIPVLYCSTCPSQNAHPVSKNDLWVCTTCNDLYCSTCILRNHNDHDRSGFLDYFESQFEFVKGLHKTAQDEVCSLLQVMHDVGMQRPIIRHSSLWQDALTRAKGYEEDLVDMGKSFLPIRSASARGFDGIGNDDLRLLDDQRLHLSNLIGDIPAEIENVLNIAETRSRFNSGATTGTVDSFASSGVPNAPSGVHTSFGQAMSGDSNWSRNMVPGKAHDVITETVQPVTMCRSFGYGTMGANTGGGVLLDRPGSSKNGGYSDQHPVIRENSGMEVSPAFDARQQAVFEPTVPEYDSWGGSMANIGSPDPGLSQVVSDNHFSTTIPYSATLSHGHLQPASPRCDSWGGSMANVNNATLPKYGNDIHASHPIPTPDYKNPSSSGYSTYGSRNVSTATIGGSRFTPEAASPGGMGSQVGLGRPTSSGQISGGGCLSASGGNRIYVPDPGPGPGRVVCGDPAQCQKPAPKANDMEDTLRELKLLEATGSKKATTSKRPRLGGVGRGRSINQ